MKKYLHILGGLLATLILASCARQEEFLPEPSPDEQGGGVYVRLHLRMARGPLTRAGGAASDGETPGTDDENKIHNFYLLVFEENGTQPVWTGEIADIQNGSTATHRIDNVYLNRTYHLYGIANLTRAQFNAIISSGNPLTYVLGDKSSSAHYTDVIDALAPGSHGEANQAAQGVMMSSEGSNLKITDTERGTEANPLKVDIELKRVVAKVHVLATIDQTSNDPNQKYQFLRTYKEDGGSNSTTGMGYIRLDRIRYFMNGTNRTTYPFARFTETSDSKSYSDPNMEMGEYDWNDSENDFNIALVNQDFVYYNQHSLAQFEPEQILNNTQTGFRFHDLESWDEIRYAATVNNPTSDSRYTQGLYTTENLFTLPEEGSDLRNELNNYDRNTGNPLPMVSSVGVAVRLAPRLVITTANFYNNIEADYEEYKKNGTVAGKLYTPDDWKRWEEIKSRYNWNTPCDWEKLSSENFYQVNFGKVAIGQPDVSDYQKEQDIRTMLTLSLKLSNHYSESGYNITLYPAGSFFVYYDQKNSKYYYMTSAVAVSEALKDVRSKILPHVGGWGYYYTYIDPATDDSSRDPHAYARSQVYRNYYYLLTIRTILTPGSTVTSNDYIRVNTERLEWQYTGKGIIDLE